jgi:predicted signal transduction protein with EAL and GGDEF domain
VGIVAEGVENAEQAAFLVAHGCDEAQGFHLGRPMPEADFERLLVAHAAGAADAATATETSGNAPAPSHAQADDHTTV